MSVDWPQFLDRMKAYPSGTHTFRSPCPRKRIKDVQTELGEIPEAIQSMLERFNGGELFDDTGPLITFFGLTGDPKTAESDSNWYIDRFTPSWRASRMGKRDEWVIGIWNYGSLVVLEPTERIKEWDTAQNTWSSRNLEFNEWIEEMIREGDDFLNEQ